MYKDSIFVEHEEYKIKTMEQQQFDDQWSAPEAPKLNAISNSFYGYAYYHTKQEDN